VTPGVIKLHRAPEHAKSHCGTPGGTGGVAPGSAP
jgi:hypothetical protein